ncbi:MAG: hypothetical protein ABL962_16200, partial [Fimbriimonadaceae bacterium]
FVLQEIGSHDQSDSSRLERLGSCWANLAQRLPSSEQPDATVKMLSTLNLIPRGQGVDSPISNLGGLLAETAAAIDAGQVEPLCMDLLNALEHDSNGDLFANAEHGRALAHLVSRLPAESLASRKEKIARGVQILLRQMQGARQNEQPLALSQWALAALSLVMQSPESANLEQVKLFALSFLLLNREGIASDETTDEKKLLELVCQSLKPESLVEILKWPFCVGSTQQIVLRLLEVKTNTLFQQDLWSFVAKARQIGITNLDKPAKRPQVESAQQELDSLLEQRQSQPNK